MQNMVNVQVVDVLARDDVDLLVPFPIEWPKLSELLLLMEGEGEIRVHVFTCLGAYVGHRSTRALIRVLFTQHFPNNTRSYIVCTHHRKHINTYALKHTRYDPSYSSPSRASVHVRGEVVPLRCRGARRARRRFLRMTVHESISAVQAFDIWAEAWLQRIA